MISETDTRNPLIETYCGSCGQKFKKHKDDPEQYCDDHRLEGT